MSVQVGYQVFDGNFGGSLAQQVVAGNFNVNALRCNTLLRKDEWQLLDKKIIEVARPRLRGVNDLLRRGLVMNLNGMETTVLQWQTQSRTQDVGVSMDPNVRANNENVSFALENLPLPFFHADYDISLRKLRVSRQGGQPLDTIQAAQKAADVAEKVENTYFNGLDSYTYGNGTIYGLTDHPQRKTATLGTSWSDNSVTGQDILDQVSELKQELINSQKHGPYVLYVPTGYETKMDQDFKANGDKTIRERILDLDNIEAVTVADKLGADNVVLVQLTGDCVEMVNGMSLTNLQWESNGGFTQKYKVMTIMVPRFFVDQEGNIGVAHLA